MYEPGTLRAQNYQKQEVLGFAELFTPEKETMLRISEDYSGDELVFLTVSLTDGSGVPVSGTDEQLAAAVEGAELLGFGSGNPRPRLNYNEGKAETYQGRAQLILRRTGTGPVRVRVQSETGKAAQIQL